MHADFAIGSSDALKNKFRYNLTSNSTGFVWVS